LALASMKNAAKCDN